MDGGQTYQNYLATLCLCAHLCIVGYIRPCLSEVPAEKEPIGTRLKCNLSSLYCAVDENKS